MQPGMCETEATAHHMLLSPPLLPPHTPPPNKNLSTRGALTSFWHLIHAKHLCAFVPVPTVQSHPSSPHSSGYPAPPPVCSLQPRLPAEFTRQEEQRINNKTAVKIKGRGGDLLCRSSDENSNFTSVLQQREDFGGGGILRVGVDNTAMFGPHKSSFV